MAQIRFVISVPKQVMLSISSIYRITYSLNLITFIVARSRKKRETFTQSFEEGATANNYNCKISASCATVNSSAKSVQQTAINLQNSTEIQVFQNFMFGADNCKQFQNCTTVPTLVTTGFKLFYLNR